MVSPRNIYMQATLNGFSRVYYMLIYLYVYIATTVNKGGLEFGWQMLAMERIGETKVGGG